MPEGKNPDDIVRTGGASAMSALLDNAEPLTDMIWRSETEGQVFDQPERRAKLNDSIRSVLATIGNVEIRAFYAEHFKEKRAALFAPKTVTPVRGAPGDLPWLNRARAVALTGETRRSRLALQGAGDNRDVLEAEILRLALGAPDALDGVSDSLCEVAFANQLLDTVRGRLISACLELTSMNDHVSSTALVKMAHSGMSLEGKECIDRLAKAIDDTCTASALQAAVDRYLCIVAVESEKPDRDTDFVTSDDDIAYRRMLEARKAGEKARQSNLYPPDENETVSVQDFIDQKIWIKKPGSRNP